jgi:hypothetical protein
MRRLCALIGDRGIDIPGRLTFAGRTPAPSIVAGHR